MRDRLIARERKERRLPTVTPLDTLIPGIDYREMRVAETGGKYRFELLRDVRFQYDRDLCRAGKALVFLDHKERERVHMAGSIKTVRKGYAWNGNSPKRGFTMLGVDVWVGTPDFLGTRMGSLCHDSDFQFGRTLHFPFTWAEVNHHYYLLLQRRSFMLSRGFYDALTNHSRPTWDAEQVLPAHSREIDI